MFYIFCTNAKITGDLSWGLGVVFSLSGAGLKLTTCRPPSHTFQPSAYQNKLIFKLKKLLGKYCLIFPQERSTPDGNNFTSKRPPPSWEQNLSQTSALKTMYLII